MNECIAELSVSRKSTFNAVLVMSESQGSLFFNMELSKIYTERLEMICMEQWVQTIIQWISKWLGTIK